MPASLDSTDAAPLRIVIVHYHLQTGGVTRVIQHACETLSAAGHRVSVLTGEPPQQPLGAGAAVEIVPGLAYEERRAPQAPAALAEEMLSRARARLGGPPDLWHIHNHCLGKNLALPGAVRALAAAGQRLLLQPHDFAEDGRPHLYARLRDRLADGDGRRLAALLYPQAPQIHYAVLNARDLRFLAAAGIEAARLHLLPNAVTADAPVDGAAARSAAPQQGVDSQRLWLYPTRAIRRKNLGELLLWAALADEGNRFATTQAPQNPHEQARYRRWTGLAHSLRLPVEFALGSRVDSFPALLASAHALVTTSVGEGFGLAFLEPWLIGRPLAGRDLPEITDDFRANGIDLSNLYRTLRVPVDWIDAARLQGAFADAIAARAAAYGRPAPADDAERAWQSAVDDGHIDSGRLDEPAQESVIAR
ncbi:MAG: glycosyltransferase family 4 protein, partial [Thiohalocapsa sp.]|nr:glycosyltransferase family 4 protein [Thiohalocapsa sp.]